MVEQDVLHINNTDEDLSASDLSRIYMTYKSRM